MTQKRRRDRQPWQKRARSSRSYQRPRPSREPRASVLIVCEGKSEKAYFDALRQELRVMTVEVDIRDPEATSAHTLFNSLKAIDAERRNDPNLLDFDEVYCVLDVEIPPDGTSRQAIGETRGQDSHALIFSNPCFEYWLLIHFERTGSAFSSSAHLRQKLKEFVPRYRKGEINLDDYYPRTRVACDRAAEVMKTQWQNEPDRCNRNPSTEVDTLVKRLHEIAERDLPPDSDNAQKQCRGQSTKGGKRSRR